MIRIFLVLVLGLFTNPDFRTTQKQFARVKAAYASKEAEAVKLFKAQQLDLHKSEIFIKVHKEEKELQLWAREIKGTKFKLVKTYNVCQVSGIVGPKRLYGDLQTPEGFYYIDRFNPSSTYHLSLGINYPNSCDKFHCGKANPGGDIFIHGKCVTIGCLPLTDEKIEELYVIAVEARNAGQQKIRVAIFPCDMASKTFEKLMNDPSYKSHQKLWTNLKEGFDYFEKNKNLPKVTESKGEYLFS